MLAGVAVVLPMPVLADKPLIDPKTIKQARQIFDAGSGIKQAFDQQIEKPPIERQRWAYGIVEHPALDADLDQVLQEIRQAAGPDAPPSRIYVTPDSSFQASATEDGSIFITVGMLRDLGSRDELAALIGHEYVHIWKKHPGKTKLEASQGVLSGLSSMYLSNEFGDKAATASRPELEYVRQSLLREAAMHSVQTGMAPNRARKQEDEADRIGVDLMVRAGYSPDGMTDLLDNMEKWEVKNKADADAALVEPGGFLGVMSRYSKNSELARKSASHNKIVDRELVNTAIVGVGASIEGLLKKAGRGHKSALMRNKSMVAYIQKNHATAYPEVRPLPWEENRQVQDLFVALDKAIDLIKNNDETLALPEKEQADVLKELRSSQAAQTPVARYLDMRFVEPGWKKGDAVAAMQKELGRPDSLFAAHRLALDWMSRYGEKSTALEMFEVSRKSLGDPPELLPYGIRFSRKAGDRGRMETFKMRCEASGDDLLIQSCLKET